MLPFNMQSRRLLKFTSLLSLGLFFISLPVLAQQANIPKPGTLSAQNMIQNIAEQIPQLMQMVTAIAYVTGMYFVISGIIKFKHFGESRTMMSQEHGVLAPIIMLVVGALLMYVPTSVEVGLSTFWTNPNPYGYTEETNQWSTFINACYLIIQFVGTIAFIRGLIILSHLGGHGGQPGTFGRGMAHIVGGILCINIYQFVQVIFVTLGIPT